MGDRGNEKISEALKKVVIARFRSMPPNLKLSVGAYGALTKDDIITHIQDGDDIGKALIEMQVSFMRSFKQKLQAQV